MRHHATQGRSAHPAYRTVRLAIALLTALEISVIPARSQDDTDLRMLQQKAKDGDTERVRSALPLLYGRYADDPGYLYLQGVTESDGDKAVGYFQAIVSHHPKCEWADDALYRLYQYHCAVGALDAADRDMTRLRNDFPSSPYLSAAGLTARTPDSTISQRSIRVDRVPITTANRSSRTQEREPRSETAHQMYAVQIASFSSRDGADNYAGTVRASGFECDIHEKQVAGRVLYAVWSGTFATLDQARGHARKIQNRLGLDPIVVRR